MLTQDIEMFLIPYKINFWDNVKYLLGMRSQEIKEVEGDLTSGGKHTI